MDIVILYTIINKNTPNHVGWGISTLTNYEISTPEMWKFTVTAEAKPAITLVVARTCFRSKNAEEFAARDAPEITATPSIVMVNVAADAAVLATTIFVTTAVVDDGTVYSVADDVAAAVLARALVVVAIYITSLVSRVPAFIVGSRIF